MTTQATKLAKLAELFGDDEEIVGLIREKLPDDSPLPEQWERQTNFREAQAVAIFLERNGEYFSTGSCENCGRDFLATFEKLTHCSIRCMKAYLEGMGIDWDTTRPPELWWRAKYAQQELDLGRRRHPNYDPKKPESIKNPKWAETESEWERRRDEIITRHPIPLVIRPDAVDFLRTLLFPVLQPTQQESAEVTV